MVDLDGEDGVDPFSLDESGELPRLELESVRPPPRKSPPSGVVEVSQSTDEAGRDVRTHESRATLPANFQVLPPDAETPLPKVEVAAVAGYGPATGIAGAIPYAIMVYGRRRELIAAAAAAAEHRERAEVDVDQALGDLGTALIRNADSLGGAVEALTNDLEAARQAVALVDQSRGAEVQAAGAREDQRREIDAELARIRAELPPHEDLETRLTTQLGVRTGNLDRARGQLQRAGIELRNARGGGQVKPESLALLEATQERRKQEVTVAEQPVTELEGKLTETRQSIAERLARLAQLEHDRGGLDRNAQHAAGQRLAEEDEAHQAAREAVAIIGRHALTAGVAATADEAAARRASAADEELVRRRRRARIAAAAIDAYDKPTLYQGLGMLGAAAIVVLLFVLVVLYRTIF